MAINSYVKVKEEITDYIKFGNGEKNLVMIPGVGDGLKTVKGTAAPFSFMYRKLSKEFTVYAFSRPRNIKTGTTTRDMAVSLKAAMTALGIGSAVIVGVSQGGMIAQWLAIDYPELIEKLILVVTLSRPNETVNNVIGKWIEMAKEGDYKGIMMSTAELSYSPKKVEVSKKLYELLGRLGRPKSFERFIIQAESCLEHNAYDKLEEIHCPTLIIGGTDDRIVTGEASQEIAERIPGSKLIMYEGLGHGLYEEAKDFLQQILKFLEVLNEE